LAKVHQALFFTIRVFYITCQILPAPSNFRGRGFLIVR